ncbi:unnamed protein product [Urochloa humidicola]
MPTQTRAKAGSPTLRTAVSQTGACHRRGTDHRETRRGSATPSLFRIWGHAPWSCALGVEGPSRTEEVAVASAPQHHVAINRYRKETVATAEFLPVPVTTAQRFAAWPGSPRTVRGLDHIHFFSLLLFFVLPPSSLLVSHSDRSARSSRV